MMIARKMLMRIMETRKVRTQKNSVAMMASMSLRLATSNSPSTISAVVCVGRENKRKGEERAREEIVGVKQIR